MNASQSLALSQPWVLAAEDNDHDYFFLLRAISKATSGVLLIRAVNGTQAMHFLQESLGQLPILLITDLRMPGIDGFGLLAWVRANAQFAKVPVFVWTGSESPKDREKANSLAAGSYYSKGISQDGLPALVAEVCGLLPVSTRI